MKYNLNKILQKLESNVIPRSMRRMDLAKTQAATMANLDYEIVLRKEPKINRPDFVEKMFVGSKNIAR